MRYPAITVLAAVCLNAGTPEFEPNLGQAASESVYLSRHGASRAYISDARHSISRTFAGAGMTGSRQFRCSTTTRRRLQVLLYSPICRAPGSPEKSDGFVAEIGIDSLLAPSELVLPKDGAASLVVQLARSSYRVPITYRLSDPRKVRFAYQGRVLDEVVAPVGDSVNVEAFEDSGEVEILVSASGFRAI